VGEPAQVGDPIVDAIGDSKCPVDVLLDLDCGVGSGDAAQTRPIRKMGPPVGDPVLETQGERRRRLFSSHRPDLSFALASPPCAFERAVGAAGAVERIELGDVLVQEPEVEKLGVLGDALTMR
jgi:hypothetical protein